MKRKFYLLGCTLLMGILMTGVAFSTEEKAPKTAQNLLITGTINDANQLVATNGKIIDVVITDTAKEMLNHTGQKVQIKGTVMEVSGKKLINVSSYELITDKPTH